jgi:hypothetical protein
MQTFSYERGNSFEELAITVEEKVRGCQRLFELCNELPIPPESTRQLGGYLYRLERRIAQAESDLAAARTQLDEERKAHDEIGKILLPLCGTDDGTSVSAARNAANQLAAARAEIGRLSAPVSHEPDYVECSEGNHCRHWDGGGICCACGQDWIAAHRDVQEDGK